LKLHGWIATGMVAGVAIGWLVGPDSPALAGEVVVLPRGQAPALAVEPGGERLPAPPRELHGVAGEQRGDWTALALRGDVGVARGQWVAGAASRAAETQTVWARTRALPALRYSEVGLAALEVLAFLGDVFLRLLKMLVVPLVLVSLTAGVASLGDPRQIGRLGAVTLGFFLSTTALAVTIGLALALVVRPGAALPADARDRLVGDGGVTVSAADLPSLADRLRVLVPENPVRALAEGEMLQIIFFAVVLGAALCLLAPERSRPLVELLDSATAAMVRMVHLVMLTAPVGVGATMATVTARSGLAVLLTLAAYAGVVLVGLALHVALCYAPAVRFLAGVPIRVFFRAARPAQVLAFGTSSSSAVLPVTMECAERGLGVSRQVATFVIPVGSTVNMDGTALYQGVAAVFIAQVFGLDLGPAELLQIVAMATLASVGAAGVPGAGMVTLTMVLTSLGLPVAGVALILGVDRILDMFRTVVNVTGDLVAATVVARSRGERPGRAA
jgi:Na+/H+-dicarboxylate symporter